MSPEMEAVSVALAHKLEACEETLRRFGIRHWKVALVCGNPKNAKESLCFTNFAGPDEVCAMIRGAETGEVKEPEGWGR